MLRLPTWLTSSNFSLCWKTLRWKDHWKVYRKLDTRPVLFIMAEKSVYADALGEYLWKTKEFGFKEPEVLVIHTDTKGEITKKDLDKAREAARDIVLLSRQEPTPRALYGAGGLTVTVSWNWSSPKSFVTTRVTVNWALGEDVT